jgi:hypothetical protein
MRKRQAQEMTSSFEVGQIVRIRSVIASKHAGQLGRVVERKAAARGSASLDKYIVMLSSGDRKEFWSVQLERNSEPGMSVIDRE